MTETNKRPLASVWRTVGPVAAALVLCAMAGARAEEIKIGGTGAGLGAMSLLADAYAMQHPDLQFTVISSMGSSGGIRAVLSGAIALGVSARPLTSAEAASGVVSHEYGRTPFVFATAAANPATDLSTQALVDIYAGMTERWPDGTRIRLVMRPVGDSDSEMIKNISPALRDAKNVAEHRKGMSFSITDQEAANNIERVPGALGVTTLAQIMTEKRPIKPLKFNGVLPSTATIADGSYPLYKTLWLNTGPKTSAAAKGFVAFVLSPTGRETLARNGHWVK